MESKLEELKGLTKSLGIRDRELHLFQQFLELLPIGVHVLDSNHNTYYFNRKATEIMGKGIDPAHPADKLSDIYDVYVAGTDEKYPFEKYPVYMSLEGVTTQVRDMEIRRPDGKCYKISVRATPIFGVNGDVEYALSTFYIINEGCE